MLIDWVTVGAQIVNFLILVWLLKKFLYGPIIRAMQKREEGIRQEMEQARQSREEAEQRAQKLEQERKELDRSREELMREARKDVEQWRDQAVDKAKEEVAAMRRSWMEGLRSEQEKSRQKLKRNMITQVLAVSDSVLRDLADRSLQNKSVEVFLKRLESSLEEQPVPAQGELLVQLGMSSEEESKEVIRGKLEKLFGNGKGAVFEEKKDLGFGIRVLVGDRKWDWNLASYLRDLEREIFSGVLQTEKDTNRG